MSTTPNGPETWGQQPTYGPPAPQQPWSGQPWGGGQPWPGTPYGPTAPGYAPQGLPSPPPAPPLPPIPGQVRPRSSGLRAAVVTVGTVIAVVALAGTATTAIARTHIFPATSVADSVPAAGISEIEIRTGATQVVVLPGSGRSIEYETTVRGSRVAEDLVSQDGGTLVFDTRGDRDWDWNWGFGWPGWDDDQQLVIRVPARLVPDLTLDAGAGEVTIEGDFGVVDLEAGLGDVTLSGTADSLRIDSGVGRVRADVATDGPVVLTGGVGEAIIDLGTTTAPESVSVEGGVGTVTLRLPVLREGYSFASPPQNGIGTVTVDAPAADPDGLPTSGQVPLSVSGGVGTVTVTASTANH